MICLKKTATEVLISRSSQESQIIRKSLDTCWVSHETEGVRVYKEPWACMNPCPAQQREPGQAQRIAVPLLGQD